MSVNAVRTYYEAQITAALSSIADTTTIITMEGDTSKPSATETRVRGKVLPIQPVNAGIGVHRIQQLGGLVQIDVIGPRLNGLAPLSTIAEAIINTITIGSTILGSDQLITYVVWEETLAEEPAYLRIPVFVRWELLH